MSINACLVACTRAHAKMLLVCVVTPWCKFTNKHNLFFRRIKHGLVAGRASTAKHWIPDRGSGWKLIPRTGHLPR